MDLMEYSQEVYQQIKADYREMAKGFDIHDIRFVPISALKGDNVVTPSEKRNGGWKTVKIWTEKGMEAWKAGSGDEKR